MTVSSALPVPLGGSCTTSSSPIRVNDSTGTARTTTAIYALISHGANGHGAYTSNATVINAGSTNTDEQTNCHCDSSAVYSGSLTPTYVQKAPTLNSGTATDTFDDIVSFRENWQMQAQNYPLSTSSCTSKYIYVTDYNNNRVQKFDMSGNYVSKITYGSNQWVYGLATDSGGNIYVGEAATSQVEKFSPAGVSLQVFGTSGHGAGQFGFDAPGNGVAVDSSGNVWATDAYGDRVLEFNSSGTYIRQIGCAGSGDCPGSATAGQFGASSPTGLRFDATGNLWVADPANSRIEEFSSTGTYITNFATADLYTYDITFDAGGNIWLSSYWQDEVRQFSSNGTGMSQLGCAGSGWTCGWGAPPNGGGTGNGQFIRPQGLAVDSTGNIWVVDNANNRVQEFSSSGTWIRSIGGPSPYTCETSPAGSAPACAAGSGNGQFDWPNSIVITNQ